MSTSLNPLRDNGIRLAIDDAGSGFSGLTTILRLRPDIPVVGSKFTIALIRGVISVAAPARPPPSTA